MFTRPFNVAGKIQKFNKPFEAKPKFFDPNLLKNKELVKPPKKPEAPVETNK